MAAARKGTETGLQAGSPCRKKMQEVSVLTSPIEGRPPGGPPGRTHVRSRPPRPATHIAEKTDSQTMSGSGETRADRGFDPLDFRLQCFPEKLSTGGRRLCSSTFSLPVRSALVSFSSKRN
jgi:hypothetical protein